MKLGELKNKIKKNNPNIEEEVKKDLAFQIGRMVMNARLSKGMTQKELAKIIKTKQPSIARIESGSVLPNLGFLDKIAKKAFNSYLIPPMFAFLKENTLGEKITNLSGTVKRDEHPNQNPIPSFYQIKKESLGSGLVLVYK